MNNKIFCGSGKEFGIYGTVNISVCLSDLPKEHITEGSSGKKYIRLKLNRKREPDQYGHTHSLEVDTWKPEKQEPKQDNMPF